jgi:hypothetical protein
MSEAKRKVGGHKRSMGARAGGNPIVPPEIDAAAETAAEARKRPGPGNPANKGNGSNPASAGKGWGGPARGAHPDKPAAKLVPGPKPRSAASIMRETTREERALMMEERLLHVALSDTECGATVVMAADKLLDRYRGRPLSTNVNLGGDDLDRLNDDEARREAQRLLAESAAARPAGPSKRLPH